MGIRVNPWQKPNALCPIDNGYKNNFVTFFFCKLVRCLIFKCFRNLVITLILFNYLGKSANFVSPPTNFSFPIHFLWVKLYTKIDNFILGGCWEVLSGDWWKMAQIIFDKFTTQYKGLTLLYFLDVLSIHGIHIIYIYIYIKLSLRKSIVVTECYYGDKSSRGKIALLNVFFLKRINHH